MKIPNSYKKLLNKRITSFTSEQIFQIDEFLYLLYNDGKPKKYGMDQIDRSMEGGILSGKDFSMIIDYLNIHGYCRNLDGGAFYDESGIPEFKILYKGELVCNQGGFRMLWEKAKNQKYLMRVSIGSAIIAFGALVVNLLFSYFKECQ